MKRRQLHQSLRQGRVTPTPRRFLIGDQGDAQQQCAAKSRSAATPARTAPHQLLQELVEGRTMARLELALHSVVTARNALS